MVAGSNPAGRIADGIIHDVQVRIEGRELPGREFPPDRGNVHVGLQRRREPVELVPGDAESATWSFECRTTETPDGLDVTGPHIQGRRGDRFVYLTWGTVDGAGAFEMFRRAKLMLDAVDPSTLAAADAPGRQLVGRLGLTDSRGGPLCAAVRPPLIEWSAESGDA